MIGVKHSGAGLSCEAKITFRDQNITQRNDNILDIKFEFDRRRDPVIFRPQTGTACLSEISIGALQIEFLDPDIPEKDIMPLGLQLQTAGAIGDPLSPIAAAVKS